MAPSRPSYLLTSIPVELRQALSLAAEEENVSLSYAARRALYEHYGLVHGHPTHPYARDLGSSSMVLRVNWQIYGAIKDDAASSGCTMRQVIIDILTDHFLVSLGT